MRHGVPRRSKFHWGGSRPARGQALASAPGRPPLRELHQRPTRPTLAEESIDVTQKVEAIYAGGVLKPTRDLCLQDQQRVRLTVETIEEPVSDREAAVARLKAGIAGMRFFCELSASEDEIDGVPLIPSACVPRHGGQADAHAIFKRPESSLA